MNKPKDELEGKKLAGQFAKQYFNGEQKKFNEFFSTIEKVQAYITKNRKDITSSNLDNRLEALKKVGEAVGQTYFQSMPTNRNDRPYSNMVDNFEVANSNTVTSFREEVNEFLKGSDYAGLGSEEINNLMSFVEATEGMETLVSEDMHKECYNNAVVSNQKITTSSSFSAKDPDVNELYNACKKYKVTDVNKIDEFIETFEQTRDKQIESIKNYNPEKDIKKQAEQFKKINDQFEDLSSKMQKGEAEYQAYQSKAQAVQSLASNLNELTKMHNNITYANNIMNAHTNYKLQKEACDNTSSQISNWDNAIKERVSKSNNPGLVTAFNAFNKFQQQVEKANLAGESPKEFAQRRDNALKQISQADPQIYQGLKQQYGLKQQLQAQQKQLKQLDICPDPRSTKTASQYTIIDYNNALVARNKNQEAYNEIMGDYNEALGIPKGQWIDNPNKLGTIGTKLVADAKANLEKSDNFKTYQNGKGRLQELKDLKTKFAPKSAEEFIKEKQDDFIKKENTYNEFKNIKDKLDLRLQMTNGDRRNAREVLNKNVNDMKRVPNPQMKDSVDALKTMFGHLDDKKGPFHRNSKEYDNMRASLEALSKATPDKYKECMEKLQKDAEKYYNTKTDNGKNVKRTTANGKVRLNYAEQINKICKTALEGQAKWEERNNALQTKEVPDFTKQDYNVKLNNALEEKRNNDPQVQAEKQKDMQVQATRKHENVNQQQMNVGNM